MDELDENFLKSTVPVSLQVVDTFPVRLSTSLIAASVDGIVP